MKLPLAVGRLPVPSLGLASFRRRIIFRGAFLALLLATLGLALGLLTEEKERGYSNYAESLRKTRAEILAKLRHPAGRLALLNPLEKGRSVTPLRPLVLPYSALDFDDQNKAQQAVELAGCSVQYPDGSSVCVAVGNNPYSGGFIYVVGSFATRRLVPRERGQLDLDQVHRARVTLEMRGQVGRWIAPFEGLANPGAQVVQGRLTGFEGEGLAKGARPVRDFRGWIWQGGPCVEGDDADSDCRRRAFYSIRLPVQAYRDALFGKRRPEWPPADLDRTAVRIEMFAPGSVTPVFDSNAGNPAPPLSLQDLGLSLLPGEVLRIRKVGAGRDIVTLKGADRSDERSAPWLEDLIRRIPARNQPRTNLATEMIKTPVGTYQVEFEGDPASVDRGLGVVATRLSRYFGAMIALIGIAWLVIEFGLIRRISELTRRAAAVSYNVQDARIEKRIGELDVSDLEGRDELGILAGSLATLLKRVKDDAKREHIRAGQERELWHAVGHEIMSPLQSLLVLHGRPDDASHRYVKRMQQAVRVLYGTASPSEALAAATLRVDAVDLNAFLANVAANAHFAGIDAVRYAPAAAPVPVRADEFPLEDVMTHLLRNADRHRIPGTAIEITLYSSEATAKATIHNTGPAIDASILDRIFEYGVSDAQSAGTAGRRGQGLFVARTYMAKMGGTIEACNTGDGVTLTLTLQRMD